MRKPTAGLSWKIGCASFFARFTRRDNPKAGSSLVSALGAPAPASEITCYSSAELIRHLSNFDRKFLRSVETDLNLI